MVKLSEQLDAALVDLKNLKDKERQHELHIEQLTEQRNHYREMSMRGRPCHDVGVSPMKVATSPVKPIQSTQNLEERELKRQLAVAVEALNQANCQKVSLLKEIKEIAKQGDEIKKDADEKGCEQKFVFVDWFLLVFVCRIIVLKLKAVVENRESKLESAKLKAEEMKKNIDAAEAKNKTQMELLARETKVCMH